MQSESENLVMEEEKKPYKTPQLIQHGTIEQITGFLLDDDPGVTGVAPSSRRWKANIQTLEGALEKVESLRGVSFDWKASGKHDIGLIAEEVGAVVPEVVAYEENGQDAIGVDYARLTALLIEAVKEQQTQIQQLHSEMEELQAERHGVLASALR